MTVTDPTAGDSIRRRRTRGRNVAFGLAAIAVLVGVMVVWSAARDDATGQAGNGAVGDAFPDVELTDPAGGPYRSGGLVGTPLVVNFWYSTCPPCRRELPDFAAVHDQLGDQVRFVGINPLDTAEQAQRFAARYGVTYDTLFDRDGNLSEALAVTGFPTTVLADATGTIVYQHTGALTADQLREALADTLDITANHAAKG
ncbi:MAG TPA: TlpA disulfide reductase family protein [Ilumatobacter sp.]|nr:TlpA disulfide reductase family protein [Ilumatobacter sp.]